MTQVGDSRLNITSFNSPKLEISEQNSASSIIPILKGKKSRNFNNS